MPIFRMTPEIGTMAFAASIVWFASTDVHANEVTFCENLDGQVTPIGEARYRVRKCATLPWLIQVIRQPSVVTFAAYPGRSETLAA
jgi:hypothetical protein